MLRTSLQAGLAGAFLALSSATALADPLVAAAGLAPAAIADEGMWLFNNPPTEQLRERYGFDITDEWLEHVRKSAVRVSTGGSGSIVSASGLVMTNHHVASDILERLSTAENDLLANGFHAETMDAELPCPDVHLDVLWSIEDVTERVDGPAAGLDAAAAGAARRKAMTEIEDAAKKETGLHAEVVTLYQGGRYHLYLYKRFDDIRMVFAPEKGIAFFGGDNDNFEYPRYCLDVTFLRIYEDGKPYVPEHFLSWSEAGAADGELTFVTGHPGSTQRLNTVAHLEYLRDVAVPGALHRLMRQEVLLNIFSGTSEEHRRVAEGDLFGIQNTRKVYLGRTAGLLDPAVFEAKRDEEDRLREEVEKNAEWEEKWGSAWDEVAAAQRAARSMSLRYNVAGGPGLGLGAQLGGYAVTIARLADELPKASTDRLREYGDASLPRLYQGLYSPAPIYPDFEMMRLESALSLMAETLGAEDPMVVAALAGKSPRARAAECILGTTLMDIEARKALVEGGASAVEAANDPLIGLAQALDPFSRELRKRYEDEVQSVERAAYAKIAAARFAVFGEGVYPDATFTLRLSYGAVKGYQDGDREIPPFTEFAGLYEKAEERAGESWYTLPESWSSREDSVVPTTKFNLVSTHDIIGGNSGSPMVNRKGEVVGLIFDGNIQSLIGNYAYSDEVARSVSVDSRGIMGALEQVYDAKRIVAELKGQAAGK
ncbi:Peptidase S46 [Planctomycetes bacterium Poly30]|uniref:Dipeptidyl-peptidase n=1 Tax=Saltatorellus ferox TaxID=2528018 RepID=A0A518EVR2_9BACT|nr:Peptidase S46 [Planctomycetes bacterium Poly30]